MQSKWTLRLVTALLWALAAGSAVYWGLRASAPRSGLLLPEAGPAQITGDSPARQATIARLLGAPDNTAPLAAPLAASQYVLAGVVAQGNGGAALLVVGGNPARPFRVGSHVDENTILQSVGPRHANLSATPDGPVVQRLEMPGALSAMTPAPTAVRPRP